MLTLTRGSRTTVPKSSNPVHSESASTREDRKKSCCLLFFSVVFPRFWSFLFLLAIVTIVTMLSCLWFAFYNRFPDHRSGVKTRMCVAGGPKKTLEEMEEIGMHEMHGMHGMHCKSDRYQICLEATACYMVIAHGLDHRATSCKRQSSK